MRGQTNRKAAQPRSGWIIGLHIFYQFLLNPFRVFCFLCLFLHRFHRRLLTLKPFRLSSYSPQSRSPPPSIHITTKPIYQSLFPATGSIPKGFNLNNPAWNAGQTNQKATQPWNGWIVGLIYSTSSY